VDGDAIGAAMYRWITGFVASILLLGYDALGQVNFEYQFDPPTNGVMNFDSGNRSTPTPQFVESWLVSGITSPSAANGVYIANGASIYSTLFTNGIFTMEFDNGYWYIRDALSATCEFDGNAVGLWPNQQEPWNAVVGSGSPHVVAQFAYLMIGLTSVDGTYVTTDTPGPNQIGFTNVADSLKYIVHHSGPPWIGITNQTSGDAYYHNGYYDGGFTTPFVVTGTYWTTFPEQSPIGTITAIPIPE